MINIQTMSKNRSGLTLVEMMISVALTLMVVFAVVRVFETLGASVTDGRATIEISGNLRSAAQLLQSDLNGATVVSLPPRSPDQGEGYLELMDGPSTDSQYPVYRSAAGQVEMAMASLVLEDEEGYLQENNYDSSVGDVDDVLAMTSHRPDKPFVGTVCDPRINSTNGFLIPTAIAPTAIIESKDAEIVWWLEVERAPNGVGLDTLADPSGNYLGQPGRQIALATGRANPMGNILNAEQQYANLSKYAGNLETPVRSLHRRVLLIRPDLDLSGVRLMGESEVDQFLSNNDISVRVIKTDTASEYRVIANSLSDLSVRENRAYRTTWRSANRTNFPRNRLATTRLLATFLNPTGMLPRQATMKDMVVQYMPGDYATTASGPSNVIMLRKGNDIVLNDVLGFDLQVWDPQARVRMYEGTALIPSDPAYATLSNSANVNTSPGCYVDLGFATYPKVPSGTAITPGNFGGMATAKSMLHMNTSAPLATLLTTGTADSTYCTWTTSYEYDGINQDSAEDNLFDEGSDGLNNDGVRGIDDLFEQETLPPYPHPLRGLKVTLRTMDFGTRQVRQTSVTKDFLPE